MTKKDSVNLMLFLLKHHVIQEKSLFIVLKVPSIHKDLKARQQLYF